MGELEGSIVTGILPLRGCGRKYRRLKAKDALYAKRNRGERVAVYAAQSAPSLCRFRWP
jgi:hypothetical protein